MYMCMFSNPKKHMFSLRGKIGAIAFRGLLLNSAPLLNSEKEISGKKGQTLVFSIFFHNLGGRFGYFLFLLLVGGERGVRGAGRGADDFY